MRRQTAGLASLLAVVLITLATANAAWYDNAPPPLNRKGQPMPVSWWQACKEGSRQHGSNPFFVAAVADIEANGWKAGRLGHSCYQGPMGFSRHCSIPDDAMFVAENQIKWACRLLARGPKALKRYNTTWYENNYVRDVMSLAKKMEAQARRLCENN